MENKIIIIKIKLYEGRVVQHTFHVLRFSWRILSPGDHPHFGRRRALLTITTDLIALEKLLDWIKELIVIEETSLKLLILSKLGKG